MGLPLLAELAGLLCSIAGIIFVRASSNKSPEVALRVGTISTSVVFIALAYFLFGWVDVGANVWWPTVAGSVGGVIIGLVDRVLHRRQAGARDRTLRRDRSRHRDHRRPRRPA
jgi:K(+)-stimulated pyrophosphate-energized sodium pump